MFFMYLLYFLNKVLHWISDTTVVDVRTTVDLQCDDSMLKAVVFMREHQCFAQTAVLFSKGFKEEQIRMKTWLLAFPG